MSPFYAASWRKVSLKWVRRGTLLAGFGIPLDGQAHVDMALAARDGRLATGEYDWGKVPPASYPEHVFAGDLRLDVHGSIIGTAPGFNATSEVEPPHGVLPPLADVSVAPVADARWGTPLSYWSASGPIRFTAPGPVGAVRMSLQGPLGEVGHTSIPAALPAGPGFAFAQTDDSGAVHQHLTYSLQRDPSVDPSTPIPHGVYLASLALSVTGLNAPKHVQVALGYGVSPQAVASAIVCLRDLRAAGPTTAVESVPACSGPDSVDPDALDPIDPAMPAMGDTGETGDEDGMDDDHGCSSTVGRDPSWLSWAGLFILAGFRRRRRDLRSGVLGLATALSLSACADDQGGAESGTGEPMSAASAGSLTQTGTSTGAGVGTVTTGNVATTLDGMTDTSMTGGTTGTCPDADADGSCDAVDQCPAHDDRLDDDVDGVPNGCDLCPGSDDRLDTDSDGVPDGCDRCPAGADHLDADADGVPDACDRCPAGADDRDADSDGVPDACDRCAFGPDDLDADADGIPDACDECPGGDDALDGDDDGVPDACDLCPGHDDRLDADADNVPDGCDVCRAGDDTLDADGDTRPDACDLCPGHDDRIDTDVDGVPDGCDRCPLGDDGIDSDADTVPDDCDVCPGGDDRLDQDGDGIPNACDECSGDDSVDTDADGTPDQCDLCPGHDDRVDTDDDGVPDGCDQCPGSDDRLDADADSIADGCDVCPGHDDLRDADGDTIPNGCDICAGHDDRLDSDGDDVPNGCDTCAGHDDNLDDDGDGVANGCDTCAGHNDNLDNDGDGVPNGCDQCSGSDDESDGDGDGVPNGCDICPGHPDDVDTDGDSVPDGCDPCRWEVRAGHLDIWVDSNGSALTLHVRHDTDGDGTEELLEPEDTCIFVPRSSYDRVVSGGGRPPIEEFSPVGVAAGEPFWVLPQNNVAGEPFLGFSSDALKGKTDATQLDFRFPRILRPAGAQAAIYRISVLNPIFSVSSAEPSKTEFASNTLRLVVPGHSHYNWTFSDVGTYDLDINAILDADSTLQPSRTARFRFIVE